jgi:hypothetical protein
MTVAREYLNPLNAKLNTICHLLALLGAHHILHVSRTRVNCVQKENCTFVVPYITQVSKEKIWIFQVSLKS